jgi:hypothetical protein
MPPRSLGGQTKHLTDESASSEAFRLAPPLDQRTAYHRYAERGYADGHDLDDWLQAEAAVDDASVNSKPPRQ